jgi:hypothetical protein
MAAKKNQGNTMGRSAHPNKKEENKKNLLMVFWNTLTNSTVKFTTDISDKFSGVISRYFSHLYIGLEPKLIPIPRYCPKQNRINRQRSK